MYNIRLFYLHIYISIFCSRLPRWLSGKGIHLPMQETQVWSLGWKDTLEEEMTTHLRILAWRIPCTWWATVHRITAESGTTEHSFVVDPWGRKPGLSHFISSTQKGPWSRRHSEMFIGYSIGLIAWILLTTGSSREAAQTLNLSSECFSIKFTERSHRTFNLH